MPSGRPPKSGKDKATRGTLRKSRVRKIAAKSLEANAYMPQRLDSDERMAWLSLAPVVRARGMMTVDYAPAFEQLCASWGRIRKLEDALKRDGMTYEAPATDRLGQVMLDGMGEVVRKAKRPAPEVQMLQSETKIFRTWLAAFGLTPMDAGRVGDAPDVPEQPAGADLLD